jgi:molecular chaperone DnaK (HSP70)
MAARRLAIDLGTATAYGAVDLGDGEPRRLLAAPLPSVVALSPSGRLYGGTRALAVRSAEPARALHGVRRLIRERVELALIDGTAYARRDLLAAVIDAVLEEGAPALRARPVDEAVLTVPADWDDDQAGWLRGAFDRAAGERPAIGQPATRCVGELAAAAAFLAARRRTHAVPGDAPFLVVDVGAAALTAGVFSREGVLGGDQPARRPIGGDDVTAALSGWALDALAADPRGPRERIASLRAGMPDSVDARQAAMALRVSLEAAKHAAERDVIVDVAVPGWLGGRGLAVAREEVDRLCEPLLEALEDAVDEALTGAAQDDDDVGAVFAVGGSALLPAVRAALATRFGDRYGVILEPKMPTARGALLADP